MLAIRHDAIRHRPHTMRTSYHGMDIHVDSIQIVDFLVPKLTAEHMGGSKFRFVTHGGGMRYLGLYSAVYKTTREGQFEALLDDIRIQLDVKFEKVDDDVLVTQKKCTAKFEEVLVHLTPTLPSQILDLLRERIQKRFQEKVCPALMKFTEKIANITQSLASIEDITWQSESAGAPCIVRHENAAWRFDTKGVKLSFKRSSPREKRSASGTSVKEIESTQNEMASVSLTEDYINEMLGELVENDKILFHLHRITEIGRALRTKCDEDGGCLGANADLDRVIDGSGHLDSRVTEAPFLEIKAHSAYLHLTLHTVLSYQNRAAHHRIPYLRLGTYMKLRIADLFVDPSDVGGRYKWSARFEIVDLKNVIRLVADQRRAYRFRGNENDSSGRAKATTTTPNPHRSMFHF
ncbi:hypothetical protein Y032_0355g3344 [Ancylostoma ceylanicum]|uniref:Uncharacterized protein n=1 Tax=Ancylostoma ceylanicum TaxID=53326 RepID=A0A016RXE3_9BILA|nr:hypothetical protein Y032_0355g3344 [Ancylostoma ceylanicum]